MSSVKVDYTLLITLPTGLVVKNGVCTCTGLAYTTACAASSTANTITLSKFVTSATSAAYSMSFSLNYIASPAATFTSGTITISLKDGAGNIKDTNTYTFTK